MKKLVAVIAIVAFLGGMSAPILANDNASMTVIELAEKDPKKADKKSDKKADKKSSDCTTAKKSECAKSCDDKK
ncbi:MAG: hypothetical protein WD577_14375 [Bacteroidales bacterium]